MKYTEDRYLEEDWFQGDEAEISCRTTKFVKVRKEHQCFLSLGSHMLEPHNVHKGEYAYYEKALVDGEFGSYYMCTDCMDAWIDECYGDEEGDDEA